MPQCLRVVVSENPNSSLLLRSAATAVKTGRAPWRPVTAKSIGSRRSSSRASHETGNHEPHDQNSLAVAFLRPCIQGGARKQRQRGQ